MIRLLCGVLFVGLCAAALPATDDTVTLKEHVPKVGERQRLTEEERTITRSLVIKDDKREDKVEKKTKVVVYVSETLAIKDGEKKATKTKRTYEKAEETTDGKTEKLPLHGLSVVIEKKGDKYLFTDENGKKLPAAAAEELEKEYTRKKEEDSLEKFIPRRPLKLGETWKIDADDILKEMVKDKFVADKKGIVATGTLTRAYKFGGHKYGAFDLKIDVPLTEMIDENNIKLKSGSAMTMHMVAEGNVEGTEPDGFATMRMSMLMLFEVPGGVDASIRVEALMWMTTEALPPRKRD